MTISTPGETMKDIRKTIAFVNHLRKYPYFTCGVQTFRPYPKCELTEKLVEEGHLYEPKRLIEWTDQQLINRYVSARYSTPWQVNGKYSEAAAYFLSMESNTALGIHHIDRKVDGLINKLFVWLAKLRNRLGFYRFPVDKGIYQRFLVSFYKRKQELERSS